MAEVYWRGSAGPSQPEGEVYTSCTASAEAIASPVLDEVGGLRVASTSTHWPAVAFLRCGRSTRRKASFLPGDACAHDGASRVMRAPDVRRLAGDANRRVPPVAYTRPVPGSSSAAHGDPPTCDLCGNAIPVTGGYGSGALSDGLYCSLRCYALKDDRYVAPLDALVFEQDMTDHDDS